MNSGILKLDWKDLAKGFVVAIIVVVLGALQQAVTAHGFDFASYDWGAILNVAWQAAGAYLMKNLLSDEQGKVFGKIG